MNYIQYLKIATNYAKKPFAAYEEEDFIRIEKVLKLEQKLNANLEIKSIDHFLESLQKEKEGVQFLLENPILIDLLSNTKIGVEPTIGIPIEKKGNIDSIKSFFTNYLKDDFQQMLHYSFKNKQYNRIKEVLKFRAYFPSATFDYVEDIIIQKIDKNIRGLKNKAIKMHDIDDAFIDLAETFNSYSTSKKLDRLIGIFKEKILEISTTPGFIYFFKVIFYGLEQLLSNPNSKIGIEVRKKAIVEFKFALSIILVLTAISIGLVFFANSLKKDAIKINAIKYQNHFAKSFYGFLTEFDKDSITNIKKTPSIKTGEIPYYNKHIKTSHFLSIRKTKQIINQTKYDIIILSDDDFDEYLETNRERFFIKPSDTLKTTVSPMRIYIGKHLAFFKANEQKTYYDRKRKRIEPRFLELHPLAKKLISKRIKNNGNVIVISDENNKIMIRSTRPFYIGGVPYAHYIIE